MVNSTQVLVKELFKKETDPSVFMNKTILIKALGIEGKIIGTFGKSGKQKVELK